MLVSMGVSGQYSSYKYKKKNHTTEAGYRKAIKQSRYLYGGLGICALNYFGDLTPNDALIKNTLKTIRSGISAFVNYNFAGNLFFRGEFIYGRLIGDDYNSGKGSNIAIRKYTRNLSFRNDIAGLSLTGHFRLLEDEFEYYKRKKVNLYLHTGLFIFYSNPKSKIPEKSYDGVPFDNAGEWVALRPLGTEGQNRPGYGPSYSAIQIGIPLGGGVRIRLGQRTDMSIEATAYYLLSDYIDDVHGNYVDLGLFDDELAKAMSDRSREEKAMLKDELRDFNLIDQNNEEVVYESQYDGKTYLVYKGFGEEGGIRGGERNDLMTNISFKISYIFTN